MMKAQLCDFQALVIRLRQSSRQGLSGTTDENPQVEGGVPNVGLYNRKLSPETVCDGRNHCQSWSRYANIPAKQLECTHLCPTTMDGDVEVWLRLHWEDFERSLRRRSPSFNQSNTSSLVVRDQTDLTERLSTEGWVVYQFSRKQVEKRKQAGDSQQQSGPGDWKQQPKQTITRSSGDKSRS